MENGQIAQRQLVVLNKNMGEVDLLQQALANATEDLSEETTPETIVSQGLDQNTLLNILQNQEQIQTHTIQLTAEQAAELGLQLEAEPEDNVVEEINEKNTFSRLVRNAGPTPIPAAAVQVLNQLNINTNKPLGTVKNPIQLIKQGDTFVSVQELDQSQLQELEVALQQKNAYDTQKNGLQNVHYDPKSNTRIVYRTVYPEELDLQTPKRGRGKRGRPKRGTVLERPVSPLAPSLVKPVRTRSGRLTKPPKHMEKHYSSDIAEENSDDHEANQANSNQTANGLEKKSIENVQTSNDLKKSESFEPTYLPTSKRSIAAQFRCPTCKKAYLGYSRMERHIKLYPDHGPMPIISPRFTPLWDTAIRSARSSLPGSRGITLLNELTNLIKTVQDKCTKMLQPATEHGPHMEINDCLGTLLRIPPGKYNIDESILFGKQNIEKVNSDEREIKEHVENDLLENGDNHDSQSLQEQLLNVQIVPSSENDDTHELILPVDTGQVSMVLDSNGPSEEVMNVDQLVSERLQSLTAAELAPPTSNSSLSLDLSLDLFQFHPS